MLRVADNVRLLVGIDRSAGMIEQAKRSLERTLELPARFVRMDANKLEFPESFFDLVTCRHSPFSAKEVYRVLAPGGVFLTQQVGEEDKRSLKAFFGRGQHGGAAPGTLLRRCLGELHEAGFTKIEWEESDTAEYYEQYEDLLFLLLHTPILPDFRKRDGDAERLRQYVERYRTPQGIPANAARFIIKAVK